jgi:thymidylate kinase
MIKPLVIALDGINGTGKSTFCNVLFTYLKNKGVSVDKIRLPGAVQLQTTNSITKILDKEGHSLSPLSKLGLFITDFSEYCEKFVQNNILNTDVLLTDRSVYSLFAYQLGMEKMDKRIISTFVEMNIEYIWPDLLLYFRVNPLNTDILLKVAGRIKKSDGDSEKTVGGYSNKDIGWFKELSINYDLYIYNAIKSIEVQPSVDIKTINVDCFSNHILCEDIYKYIRSKHVGQKQAIRTMG